MKAVKLANIDAYIAAFPEDVQKILGQVRLTVSNATPRRRRNDKLWHACFLVQGPYNYLFCRV